MHRRYRLNRIFKICNTTRNLLKNVARQECHHRWRPSNGVGMSTVYVLPEVWVYMSSTWMHRRGRLDRIFKICNTTRNTLTDVASRWRLCWWRPSMVLVCQLYMCYQKFEFICHPHGCIEENGWADWSIWLLQCTIHSQMWLTKSTGVGVERVWCWYVICRCHLTSLS